MREEYLDIVDDANKVIGKALKKLIYERKLTHRIVHVFVVHPDTKKNLFTRTISNGTLLTRMLLHLCRRACGIRRKF
ncbi:hypothetical protein J4457_05415 [Candidatus Woesearchaeota archaeon]|nr:hypothetical protein [Candidatus Woesearchaeota archaeon]